MSRRQPRSKHDETRPASTRQKTLARDDLRWNLTLAPVLAIAGIFLIWAVLTKSLPFALAERDPELALRLNPDNPAALIALAQRARTKLLELTAPIQGTATIGEAVKGEDAAPTLSIANADQEKAVPNINALRKEIGSLVARAIANDPLNARGFRLLAEVADTPEHTRLLMKEAVKRSRRESIAVFWLLADSFERKDFSDVVDKADILLRTGSDFGAEVMRYLGALAEIPEGRAVLVATLARLPSWRGGFFHALPQYAQFAGTPFEIMSALKDAGSAVAASELAPYFAVLLRENLVLYAYDVWRELLPDEAPESASLLTNSNFADNPSGLPFDWLIRRGENAIVEFAPPGDKDRSRSLRFSFSAGRVAFPELSQLITLAPGHYRLNGEVEGMITARRGLRWEIHCWKGKELAKTEMLYGHPRVSQPFGLDIEVPDNDDCRSQQLRLFHDSRSASEQLISGQLSVRGLSLIRTAP